MEKLKQYKYIIILVLLVLAGAFYWYSYRPVKIIKDCYRSFPDYLDRYRECLRRNGLEK